MERGMQGDGNDRERGGVSMQTKNAWQGLSILRQMEKHREPLSCLLISNYVAASFSHTLVGCHCFHRLSTFKFKFRFSCWSIKINQNWKRIWLLAEYKSFYFLYFCSNCNCIWLSVGTKCIRMAQNDLLFFHKEDTLSPSSWRNCCFFCISLFFFLFVQGCFDFGQKGRLKECTLRKGGNVCLVTG